jgi:hypothetical protein
VAKFIRNRICDVRVGVFGKLSCDLLAIEQARVKRLKR